MSAELQFVIGLAAYIGCMLLIGLVLFPKAKY
jgi:hypothetical protein